jgi:hypothetical protein
MNSMIEHCVEDVEEAVLARGLGSNKPSPMLSTSSA